MFDGDARLIYIRIVTTFLADWSSRAVVPCHVRVPASFGTSDLIWSATPSAAIASPAWHSKKPAPVSGAGLYWVRGAASETDAVVDADANFRGRSKGPMPDAEAA